MRVAPRVPTTAWAGRAAWRPVGTAVVAVGLWTAARGQPRLRVYAEGVRSVPAATLTPAHPDAVLTRPPPLPLPPATTADLVQQLAHWLRPDAALLTLVRSASVPLCPLQAWSSSV
jgi:hypothetical protein